MKNLEETLILALDTEIEYIVLGPNGKIET